MIDSVDADRYDERGNPTLSQDALPLFVTGGAFILDAPDTVPAVWGAGDRVLWAEGESVVIAGQPGVGKTTLAGQVLRGRLLGCDVLGLPVRPTRRRVLYLAMDRPRQIARALRRTLSDLDRDLLDDRLVVLQGPPPADIARHPEVLIGLAAHVGADTLVVDSLKDAAVGLSDDDVGAGYNRARQMAIAEGVEVLELHHTVKRNAAGGKATSLADLYGSTWIASGAGSVVLLHGDPGDLVVELRHLKQPAAEVGPFKVQHDHDTGRSSIVGEVDLVTLARGRHGGITAKDAARVLFDTDKPTVSQVEKARRRLRSDDRLAEIVGDKTTNPPTPSRWQPPTADPSRNPSRTPSDREPTTDPSRPSRDDENPQVKPITEPLTAFTPPTLHAAPRPCKDGAARSQDDDRCRLHPDEARPDACHTCERVAAS